MSTSTNTSNSKYVTLYTADNKVGDALNETLGWNSDTSQFITSDIPLFLRGGNYNSGTGSGIFSFVRSYGDPSITYTFRTCLIA